MDLYSLTDRAIERLLGERIKGLRLRLNITQEDLAAAAYISRRSLVRLEAGEGSRLGTIIAVLRELRALDDLDSFVPVLQISPIELARIEHQGQKRRKRASRNPAPLKKFKETVKLDW